MPLIPLAPADLFAPGTPWPDTLAAWTGRTVVDEMARRLQTTPDSARDSARASFFAQGLDAIRQGDVAVTMGRDPLRVHIRQSQLTPSVVGSFDVGVPYPVVRPFARRGSVLAHHASRSVSGSVRQWVRKSEHPAPHRSESTPPPTY